jgi:hypothetical protein
LKAKYHKGGDLPEGTVPAYTYCHSSDKKDRIREETAALTDLMFRCSDCFSLTVTEWYKTLPLTMQQRKNPLRDALRPYFVQKFTAYNWYGWINCELEIFVYRCCPETREILAEYCPELFIHSIRDKYTVNRHPEFEDLCFYRNGKMTLGSLSHEYMCTVYPPDNDENFENSLSFTGTITKTTAMNVYTLPEK